MNKMTTHSNSYEYLIKLRQLTWENAEFIDSYFGYVKLEDRSVKKKDVKVENTCQKTYETTCKQSYNHEYPVAKQCYSQAENRSERKNSIYLDYNKLTNVRVSLSAIDCDEYIDKCSSSDEVPSQPAVSSDSTSKDDPSVVASTREKRNTCTICQKKFQHKSKLTTHLRTHTGEKPFSCPQCEKMFARKGDLNKHLLIHSGTKQFSCAICHKVFSQKSHLTAHHRIHTGDKPFECTLCNAMFSDKSSLTRHMRTHTGETPYQCEICEKKFNRSNSLKTHLLIHSEKKPFSCTYANCNKTCRTKGDLQKHARVHTKERPYSCPLCNKAFSYSSSCRRHASQCPAKGKV